MKKLLITLHVLDEDLDVVATDSKTIDLKSNYERISIETKVYQETDRVYNDTRFLETDYWTESIET